MGDMQPSGGRHERLHLPAGRSFGVTSSEFFIRISTEMVRSEGNTSILPGWTVLPNNFVL